MATTAPETLAPPVIDYADGVERFGGDAALFERFALRYLDDAHYDALMVALKRGDLDEAYREAHALKGVAGTLSLPALYRAAAAEAEALRARNPTKANAVLPALTHAHRETVQALSERIA